MKKVVKKVIDYAIERYLLKSKSIPYLIEKKAAESSVEFMFEHMRSAHIFKTKEALWDFVLSEVPLQGLALECGIYKGYSINYFAKADPERMFYGFDSFEGLEEHWIGRSLIKGHFNLNKNEPSVAKNVTLVPGWLKDTYAEFLVKKNESIALLHIDTDTYTPAYLILKESLPYLKIGTIIIFDELVGYPNWQNNEYRALAEVLPAHTYEYLAYASSQVAIRITKLP